MMTEDQKDVAYWVRAAVVSSASLAAVFAFAALAVGACAPEFDRESCSVDSDCFEGEICVEGECQVDTGEDVGDDETGDSGQEIAELSVEPETADVQVGSTIQLTATARDADGDEVSGLSELSWSSSDTDVATVEAQEMPEMADVTGASEGTATITATLGELEATAEVTVTEESVNNEPVADAGSDQMVTVGTTVQLDGSGSMDPDMDELTYDWSFASTPSGSSASLQDATTVQPSFTADVVGDYEVELTVSDGEASNSDTVVVTADPGGMDADGGMDVEVGDTGDTGLDTQGPTDTTDTSGETTGMDTTDATDTSSTDTSATDTSDTSATDTSSTDTSGTDTSSTDTSSTDTSSTDT